MELYFSGNNCYCYIRNWLRGLGDKGERGQMETEELLKKRLGELARRCYQNNQYTFTGFLSMADMACFYGMEKELSFVPYTLWGGSDLCERVMIRFGSGEEFGYEEPFPIACLHVKPLAAKFADQLGHRDILGALMNLGIERSTVGDIILGDKEGYIFCLENMADFIMGHLDKVKHTSVVCTRAESLPAITQDSRQEIKIQISSERIDGVLSKVYRLSRGEAIEYFRQKKVFLNGRLCENNSQMLKSGDVVSARGCGKFDYCGQQNISKKGKINASVMCYGKR